MHIPLIHTCATCLPSGGALDPQPEAQHSRHTPWVGVRLTLQAVASEGPIASVVLLATSGAGSKCDCGACVYPCMCMGTSLRTCSRWPRSKAIGRTRQDSACACRAGSCGTTNQCSVLYDCGYWPLHAARLGTQSGECKTYMCEMLLRDSVLVGRNSLSKRHSMRCARPVLDGVPSWRPTIGRCDLRLRRITECTNE